MCIRDRNNPTTNAYNAALQETLKKEFLEKMEQIRLGDANGLTNYSDLLKKTNVQPLLKLEGV